MSTQQRTAIFPGSFDPFTKGHADLVERGLQLFDNLIIAVGYNEQKQGWIPTEERVKALQALYANDNRIKIKAYKKQAEAIVDSMLADRERLRLGKIEKVARQKNLDVRELMQRLKNEKAGRNKNVVKIDATEEMVKE